MTTTDAAALARRNLKAAMADVAEHYGEAVKAAWHRNETLTTMRLTLAFEAMKKVAAHLEAEQGDGG